MKRKKLYGALFAVCAALTAAFIVCAVLFNRGREAVRARCRL